MKFQTLKPYAKLKDCAGQRFVGGSLDRQQKAILVFENAWCMVTHSSDEEEGPRFSEHQYSLEYDWALTEDAVRLGVLSREHVDEMRMRRSADEAKAQEERERRQYEQLKAKFEGTP